MTDDHRPRQTTTTDDRPQSQTATYHDGRLRTTTDSHRPRWTTTDDAQQTTMDDDG